MKKALFGAFLGLLFPFCYGQTVDTTSVLQDSVKPHSPKKAIIFSAIVPGAGQVYNHMAMPKGKKKAYWKVPLIYAGLGVTGYYLINNQQTQGSLRTEYENRLNNQPLNAQWELYDDQAVLTLYNQYLNWRDLSILAFGAVYILQVVDAGIEAHFVEFDISPDLSLALRPTYLGQSTVGVKMNFNFR